MNIFLFGLSNCFPTTPITSISHGASVLQLMASKQRCSIFFFYNLNNFDMQTGQGEQVSSDGPTYSSVISVQRENSVKVFIQLVDSEQFETC